MTLFLLKTFFAPMRLNSLMAMGEVMSLPSAISTFAFISSPGVTAFTPACFARIFSVIVIGLIGCLTSSLFIYFFSHLARCGIKDIAISLIFASSMLSICFISSTTLSIICSMVISGSVNSPFEKQYLQ